MQGESCDVAVMKLLVGLFRYGVILYLTFQGVEKQQEWSCFISQ